MPVHHVPSAHLCRLSLPILRPTETMYMCGRVSVRNDGVVVGLRVRVHREAASVSVVVVESQ